MKYSEFKAEVEKLGFEVLGENEWKRIYVLHNDENVACISTNTEHTCDTDMYCYYLLSDEKRRIVLDLVSKLALTPLAEREEEKRYRLRIVANLGFMNDQRFLNLNIEREDYFICSARQSEWVKTIFTESEIAEMDITGFQKVEVTPE